MIFKNFPLRDDGSYNLGETHDVSRPFPQITFRVKTYDKLDLFSSDSPGVSREEQMRQIYDQTVWVDFWPFPLKNGDTFTLYGDKAITVFENLEKWAQLEIAYFGPPVDPTPVPTPNPTVSPYLFDIAYNNGLFDCFNSVGNFSITFYAGDRSSNFNKIKLYSNRGYIFPEIVWSLSYYTNPAKNRIAEEIEVVGGPNVVCLQIGPDLFEYTFTFNKLSEILNKSTYDGNSTTNQYTLSTKDGLYPNLWMSSSANNYTTNTTRGFGKANPNQLPDTNGNYLIFDLVTDNVSAYPTPTPSVPPGPTATQAPTPTSSPTMTPSATPSVTPSPTPTATPAPTPYGQSYISGYNNFGQMASTNTTAYKVLTSFLNKNIWDVNTINLVSAGVESNYILRSDNTIWSIGNGSNGRLGVNNTITHSSPVQIAGSSWANLAAGWTYSLGVKLDGTLWGWGRSTNGYLGNGAISPWPDVSQPIQIGSATDWPLLRGKIASGLHTLAIKQDGTLWTWGQGQFGQLGNNFVGNSTSPVMIGTDNSWKYVAVSNTNLGSGETFSTAIKNDGTLWVWGKNTDGVFGINQSQTILQSASSPIQVGTGTDWKYVNAGNRCIWAVKNDNTLWAWGENTFGQLGQNDRIHRSSPVQITGTTFNFTDMDKFSLKWRHGLVIDANEDLFFVGENFWGEGAEFVTNNRSVLTQVSSNKYFKKVFACHASTFVLGVPYVPLRYAGNLYAWGENYPDGYFGNNSSVGSYSPVQVAQGEFYQLPETINGTLHYIKSDGTLWGWGDNYGGSVGVNNTVKYSSPVQVGNQNNWRVVRTKSSFDEETTVYALNSSGELWAWGDSSRIIAINQNYPLGDGSYIDRSTPIQLAVGTSFTYLSHGTKAGILAISDGGQIWGVGQSRNGNLLIANTNTVATATVVNTDTNWSKAEIAYNHGIGIRNNGSLWSWGSNASGQLGLNNTASNSNPTRIGLGTDWDIISLGEEFSFAIKQDGTLWSWGSNSYGQLGLGDTIDRSSPTQIGNTADWQNVLVNTKISIGGPEKYFNIVGLKVDGTVWNWGYNYGGKLGDGTSIHRSSPVQTTLGDNQWVMIGLSRYTTFGLRFPDLTPAPTPTPTESPTPTPTPTPT